MSTALHEVASEVAYDLMQDHLDTILRLIEGPLERGEVVRRVGSEKTVERMVRYGLVANEGAQLRASSSVFQQMRREGMVTFLERYVLPSLAAAQGDAQPTTLETHYLAVPVESMRGIAMGPVQGFFEELAAISDRPTHGPASRLSVLVVGTTDVVSEDLDPGEQALRHLQRASLQRANPTERELAVVSQFDCLADDGRYGAALESMQRFLSRFVGHSRPGRQGATYHLTVATHWRNASPAATAHREAGLAS